MCLKNIRIENLSKISYDCFAQQILVLCQYYYGNYWKLFLDDELCLSKILYTTPLSRIQVASVRNYEIELQKYYGLKIEERKNIHFINDTTIYLIAIVAKVYPLYTGSLLNQHAHFFLIYGEIGNQYIVNDNYYDTSYFLIDKTLVNRYALKKYLVKREDADIKDINIQAKIDKRLDGICREWFSLDLERDILERCCDDAVRFLVLLQKTCEYIDGTSKILENYSKDVFDVKESSIKLLDLMHKISIIFYSCLKEYTKGKGFKREFVENKYKKLIEYLFIEKEINEEVKKT